MSFLFIGWDFTTFRAFNDVGGVKFSSHYSESAVGAGRYDAAFTYSALVGDDSFNSYPTFDIVSSSEFWLHFTLYGTDCTNVGTRTGELITMYFANNWTSRRQIRLVCTNASTTTMTLKLQKSTNGTTFTDIVTTPATFAVALDTRNRFDIYLKLASTGGVATVYVNEASVATFTGNTSTLDNAVENITLLGEHTPAAFFKYWSEVIVGDATTSTVGCRLFTMYPTASGAQSDFTGTFADVDDVITFPAVIDTQNFITSNSNAAIHLFNCIDLGTGFNKHQVMAVKLVAGVTITTDSTPTDFKFAYRHNNTTNFLSSAVGATRDNSLYVYSETRETNPVTGQPWTFTDINALQIGIATP